MGTWQEPAYSRWWLEGDGTGSGPLTLVTETVPPGTLTGLGPQEPPERPRRASRPYPEVEGLDGAHQEWLSFCGVGVSPSHERGAHGWVDYWATARPDPPKRQRRRRR